MQPMSMSARTRTIEKSTTERSHLVVLRRVQAQTTHDLFLSINGLARRQHAVRLVACCENPCADSPLAARPCCRLLSCRPNFSCACSELSAELRRRDQVQDASGLLADRTEMHAPTHAVLWHEVSIEVPLREEDRGTFEL
jgi:hypothetical protein